MTNVVWRRTELDQALRVLLKGAGANTPLSPNGDVQVWLSNAAAEYGFEAVALETTYGDLAEDLVGAAPFVLQIAPEQYLAVIRATRRHLFCATRSGTSRRLHVREVCRQLRATAYPELQSRMRGLLQSMDLDDSRAADMLLNQQVGSEPFRSCWVLRPHTGAKGSSWLRQSGLIRNASVLLSAHMAQYVLWLLSWAVISNLSFAGRMDSGWLLGWALLLFSMIPFRALETWLQGVLAIGVGSQLKRRLVLGALRLSPEQVRTGGIGTFLGQALEAEMLESLALGGGVAAVLAIVDLVVSAAVLGKLILLLGVWLVVSGGLAYRFLKAYGRWSDSRLSMTGDLVESMSGQRTRLAQLDPVEWHVREEDAFEAYLSRSSEMDAAGTHLSVLTGRGWLLLGIAGLAPSAIFGTFTSADMALAIGGILLAYSALDRLSSSFADVAAAWFAWSRVEDLFQAAETPELRGHAGCLPSPTRPVVEGERLAFRYRAHGPAVLESADFSIWQGDRVLLEGGSGGGKTTLVSLLSGIRQPQSGLLLSGGMDMHSLGMEQWRQRIVSVPQFHENHIVSETLLFNLLMGKRWPPTREDVADAQRVCFELGLGPLLGKMPGGLMQIVGDGGWQLSHGERSRVFIARALLQNPELMILDESFGALDPENLETALQYTLERAKSLMVIAHP